MHTWRILLMLAVAACGIGAANGTVVNVDFEGGLAGDQTYAGDDAALSSAGGTVWNSVMFTGAADLLDEFGGNTPFDVEIFGDAVTSNPVAGNVLQDSGAAAPMNLLGLIPGETYTLAGYVDTNGGFGVTDATGPVGFFAYGAPDADGWSLPGTEGDGGDYFLVQGLQPYEVETGKWGVSLVLDGTMTGLQISGAVPEPSSLLLLGIAALLSIRRR